MPLEPPPAPTAQNDIAVTPAGTVNVPSLVNNSAPAGDSLVSFISTLIFVLGELSRVKVKVSVAILLFILYYDSSVTVLDPDAIDVTFQYDELASVNVAGPV